VGEIDDVAQNENKGKAECHQHVERANDESVGDIKQKQLCHNSPKERSPYTADPGGGTPGSSQRTAFSSISSWPLDHAAGVADGGSRLVAGHDFFDLIEVFGVVLAGRLGFADKGRRHQLMITLA